MANNRTRFPRMNDPIFSRPMTPEQLRDHREMVEEFLGWGRHSEDRRNLSAPRMRDDRDMYRFANTMSAEVGRAVNKFLDRGGNIEDVHEVLAAHIGKRGFLKIAERKHGLVDPLA